MARTRAYVVIHKTDGTTFNVPITTGARRTWGLMREDCIRLRWDDVDEYRALVGDWVYDELFGKFFVTEEQEPTFDTATGAYRHDVRFDRDYIGWKNVLHMLTYDTGGSSLSRKETEWTLTDSLANHLNEIVKGLRTLGYSCGTPVVESGVENPGVAVSVTFSGTSVYDALNALAGAYSCEWWVTYDSGYTTSTIHFGKHESGNELGITLGVNAEDVTPTESGGVRANRIFAFGSTRNIPETYRKTLTFTVTDTATRTYDGQSATVFRDASRVITKDMLKTDDSLSKGVNLSLGSFIYGDSTTDPQYRKSATAVSAFTLTDAVRYGLTGDLSVMAKFTRNDDTEEDGEWSWALTIDGAEIASGGGDLTGHLVGDTTITVNISETISDSVYLTAGEHTARLEILTLNSHFYLQYAKATTASATLTPSGFKVNCPLLYNGTTYIVTFNPLSEPYSAGTFNWFSFVGSAPSGFGTGDSYTLMLSDGETAGLLPLKIPVSFYSDNMGDISSTRMVGARRLMLPSPGYVESGSPSGMELVEKVVIFENIYPKLYLQVTEITEGTYTDNTEWSDGSRSYGSLPKYTIKARRITSGGLQDFPFKRDYLTSDPLQAVFVTYDEAHGPGSSRTNFLLSGMTFGLNFNEAAQTYTIAFNEDYGAKLPNGILKPNVGDAFILTGWNVNAIESLGLIDDAEDDLQDAAETYLEAVSKPTFTWRCRMMSDSMMSGGLLNPGQKVRIVRGSLEDSTRVIGFEYKLDIPEDTPEYECGETEAYSRLRELEKALNARAVNTASASGGVITSSSSSGSSSESGSLSAVLSWQAGTVDPATFDTFDGSEDKLINIPSEIDHLSDGNSVPRIDEVIETRTDGSKVVRLVDGSGNTVLPSGAMDWFVEETYTEDNTTKRRLKLNPKYQGMYAEGWVSAGGVSGTGGGGGGASSLKDLTDVDDNLNPSSGQVLTYDGTKWTAVPGGQGSVTGITVGGVPYSPVSGIVALPAYPTSLPASDVYAWAKAASKPSYSFSEITGTASASQIPSLAISKITGLQSALDSKADASALAGYIPKGGLSTADGAIATWGTLTSANGYSPLLHWSSSDGGDWNLAYKSGQISMQLDGWYYQNEGQYRVLDTSDIGTSVASQASLGNYLPLSGGTMANTNLVANLNADLLDGFDSTYFASASGLANANTVIEGAVSNITTLQSYFTNGVANSAASLGTARYIWGQPFDGTDNVDGILTLTYASTARATGIEVMSSNSGEASIGFASTNRTVFGRYADRGFIWGSVAGEIMSLLDNGNVGVGMSAPSYKVDVAGDLRTSGKVYIGTTGGYLEVVNVGTQASPSYALRSTLPFYSDSWVSAGGVGTSGGGGGSSYLGDLLDVSIDTGTLATNQVLKYNNGTWVNGQLALGDLSNVNLATAPSDGNVLMWDDTAQKWVPGPAGVSGDYLPLSGGQMSGSINMPTGSSTNTGPILRFRHESDGSQVFDAYIGANNAGTMALFAANDIRLRPGNSSSYGLVITTTDITYNGVSIKPKFFYGVSSSSGNTRTVTASGFTSSNLTAGTVLVVQMGKSSDTNSNVTINVNSTGAKYIYSPAGYKSWKAGENVLFVYTSSGDWAMQPTYEYIIQHVSGGGGTVVSGVSTVVGRSGDVTVTHIADALTGAGYNLSAYTLPAATSGALGGIRLGYTQSGKNYPVLLDSGNRAYVNVPWQSGSGGSTVSVAQGAITSATYGTAVGTITVDGTGTTLYAPKVTVTQTLSTGVEVGRIKVGSSTTILYAPDGGSGTSGVASVAGYTGTVTTAQIATALTNDGYKLTDTVPDLSNYVTTQGLNTALSGYATTSSLNSYLPLTAGSGKALTGTLYSRAIIPTTSSTSQSTGYDLGGTSAWWKNTYTRRVYLADGIYVYYDETNNCIRTNAPIVSDSYISAGGVSTT